MNFDFERVTGDLYTNDAKAYEMLEPEQQLVPFVFNSPHSGRCYPIDFLRASRLDPIEIRMSEDFVVDALFAGAVNHGAPMLMANFARAYLDVNREPYELDPKMFAGKLPIFVNTKSLRVAGGLGTVPRIVSERNDIYREKLEVDEVLERIDALYKPYHDKLRDLLAQTFRKFGYCILMDCHSMPSALDRNQRDQRPDFVIGDRYGSSADNVIVEIATSLLREMGFNVAVNKPYAGGFITQHYGRPRENMHALQIEINRRLYMDEQTMCISEGFDEFRLQMDEFIRQMVLLSHSQMDTQFSLAAE